MRSRNLARAGWAVAISLVAGALVLGLAGRPGVPIYEVTSTIITPTFATLGALIVVRRPGNVIGWIFLAAGVLGGTQMFSGQYAKVALAPDGPTLPGGALAAWCANLAQNAFIVSILFLLLLFPDGTLLSRRWRSLAWAIGTFIAVSLIIVAVSPGPFVDFPSANNPLGVEGATPSAPVLAAGQLAVLGCVVAAILSLAVRFYRSRGEERLQLKWFTYAAVMGLSTPLLLSELAPAAFDVLGRFVWTLGFLSLPVSAAVAILKYRLYDIDLLINRTLVYGSLTATLALVYFGGVTLLQGGLRSLTGHESTLVVVSSTLLIAALFSPLRRRIQSLIDKRFYRRKYDARKTLEAFSVKLRDETDLGRLREDLISVVRDTLQPASASLWLRTFDRRSTDSGGSRE